MGKSADELISIKEEDDSSDSKRLGDIFQEANHKIWNFRCKAKLDSFQEQQRYFPVAVSYRSESVANPKSPEFGIKSPLLVP